MEREAPHWLQGRPSGADPRRSATAPSIRERRLLNAWFHSFPGWSRRISCNGSSRRYTLPARPEGATGASQQRDHSHTASPYGKNNASKSAFPRERSLGAHKGGYQQTISFRRLLWGNARPGRGRPRRVSRIGMLGTTRGQDIKFSLAEGKELAGLRNPLISRHPLPTVATS
jgi:hypothetical protein